MKRIKREDITFLLVLMRIVEVQQARGHPNPHPRWSKVLNFLLNEVKQIWAHIR
jgi:hypothetical protein